MLSDNTIKFLKSKFIQPESQKSLDSGSHKKETNTSVGIAPKFFVGYKLPSSVRITAEYALRVLLYLITFQKEIPYWENEKIYRTLTNRAFLANYQGKWHLVQEILELENPTLETVYQKWTEKGGSFRSFQSLFKKVILKEEYYRSPLDPTLIVVRPQRKRGYDDKGSSRLNHEHHGIPGKEDFGEPGEKTERIDRRNKVAHPLIEKDERRETTADNVWDSTRSDQEQKEETDDGNIRNSESTRTERTSKSDGYSIQSEKEGQEERKI